MTSKCGAIESHFVHSHDPINPLISRRAIHPINTHSSAPPSFHWNPVINRIWMRFLSKADYHTRALLFPVMQTNNFVDESSPHHSYVEKHPQCCQRAFQLLMQHVHNNSVREDYTAKPGIDRRPDNAFLIGPCTAPQFLFRFIADFIGCEPPTQTHSFTTATTSVCPIEIILLQEWNPVKLCSEISFMSRFFVCPLNWWMAPWGVSLIEILSIDILHQQFF